MAATNTADNTKTSQDIVMGSGKLYLKEVLNATETMPDWKTIAVSQNFPGHIKGGFTYTFDVSSTTVGDDLNEVEKTLATEKKATASCGLITWDGRTVAKFVKGCTVTEENGYRITEIGGNNTENNHLFWCVFVPTDNSRIVAFCFKGDPIGGLNGIFKVGESNNLEPKFSVVPYNSNGDRYKLVEKIAGATQTETTTDE